MNTMQHPLRHLGLIALFVLALTALGCDGTSWDWGSMNQQPHYKPYAASEVLPDGTSSQMPPVNTVSRTPELTYEQSIPKTIDMTLLKRGQERFNIYCAVCHGQDGYGQGMVVRRGFPQPPSLHEYRLHKASNEYLYDVITLGRGKMASYSYELAPKDRQAVIAYIRALQLSQNASPDMLTPDQQALLQQSPAKAAIDPAHPAILQLTTPKASPAPPSQVDQRRQP